jgi:putative transposase
MQLEGKIEVATACELAQVSRAGFYRGYVEHAPRQAEVALRDAIQRAALQNPFYGYRRVTAELQHQGWVVNHKCVLRLTRLDNLLSLRRRKFVLTSDSRHCYGLYANLAESVKLVTVNQLWVADITYIRLRESFIYLAVVLDAFSRKVLGWELGETLETSLPLAALDRALANRVIPAGMVHHSDRGLQYASKEYIDRLLQHGFLISMSRVGSPWENAKAESFMKTLKCEEVHLRKYRDLQDARTSIGHFLEDVYNCKRLHSALGYQSPVAFETRHAEQRHAFA